MKINSICLVIIGLIVFALATSSHSAPEPGATPVVVKDKDGKQVGLYKESHALVMGRNPSHFKGNNLPVESVTWYEADEYCKKVNKRLPSEWEWEKSVQGGTTPVYHWGDNKSGGFRCAR